ncbi:MAG: AtpZ/AtpI family protein [Fidelibacterota bacterium]
MGTQIAFTFAFFILGGWWLDNRFGTLPLFLITGIVLAFISFFYLIYKTYVQGRK